MKKGLKAETEDEVLRAYQNQEIHLSEAARLIDMDIFDFLRFLSEKNMTLNVPLEDWLGSSSI
jgi:predicted HTH domain antitoxin